jgi:hypothetical protein
MHFRPAPMALIEGALPPPGNRRDPTEEHSEDPHERPASAASEHRWGCAVRRGVLVLI